MPSQLTKLIEKAKTKLTYGLCGSNDQDQNQSTYISMTKVDFQTPVKCTNQTKTLKKNRARLNLFNEKNDQSDKFSCDQSTLDISKFPFLITSPQLNDTFSFAQFESSEIFESTTSDYGSNISSAFSNVLYESPECRQNTTRFSQMEIVSFGFDSKDFQSANSLLFAENEFSSECNQSNINQDIFVCKLSYEAKSSKELTINFSDRLAVLNENEQICFVKNIITNQYGFVPCNTICKLSEFLSDIKQLTNF